MHCTLGTQFEEGGVFFLHFTRELIVSFAQSTDCVTVCVKYLFHTVRQRLDGTVWWLFGTMDGTEGENDHGGALNTAHTP